MPIAALLVHPSAGSIQKGVGPFLDFLFAEQDHVV